MRKLYTGPFGPMARMIWTEKAKAMIKEGRGEHFLYILPTSQLLKTVRDELLHSLGGISTIHLLTFDEIAERIVRELGPGAEIMTSYELGRFYDQVLTKLSGHPMMGEFKDYFHLRGLRSSLMKMMGEWKRSGFTVYDAENLLGDPNSSPRSRALAFFYIESEKYMEELSITRRCPLMTRESRLFDASQALQEQPEALGWLQSIDTLWVDHFTDFSPLQFELLRGLIGLANMRQVGIYLPYQADYYRNLNYLHVAIHHTILDLETLGLERVDLALLAAQDAAGELSSDWDVSLPAENRSLLEANQSFKHLSDRLFTSNEVSTDIPMQLAAFQSPRKEVQFITKTIKQQLLNDVQLCPQDIAIISGDAQRFQPIIEEEFERAQLPLRSRRKVALTELPLVQQLRAFLEVKLKNWDRNSLAKLIQGDYIDWEYPAADGVAVWMKKKGLVEGFERWNSFITSDLQQIQKTRDQIMEANDSSELERQTMLNSCEREAADLAGTRDWFIEVKGRLSMFPANATMQTYIQAANHWLETCGIPQRLVQLGRSKQYTSDLLRRDVQAWQGVVQSLQELYRSAEKLGELARPVSYAAFVSEWMELWQEKTVQLKPGNEQGIYFLEASAARGLSFKQVYVMGCNEGVFPKTHRESWLLDDVERVLMQDYGTMPASHYHNEMERMFFLMAISLATNQLVLSYVASDGRSSMQPSSFIHTLLKKLPAIDVLHPTDDWATAQDRIASVEEYRQWLAKMGNTSGQPRIQLYREQLFPRWLFSHVLDGVHVEHQRHFGYFGAWDGNLKGPAIEQELKRMFSSARRFSVSQINEYISSPLTFFFRRVLGVQTPEEWSREVASMDKGNILHESLRRFYSKHHGEILSGNQLPSYQMELEQYFQEEAKRFAAGSVYEQSKLWELEVQRLSRELSEWLQNELTEQKMAGFYPAFLELSFGLPNTYPDQVDPASQGECIELTLGGEQIRLYGKIDRIDRDALGHFVVYDYKLSLGKYGDYKELNDGSVNYQLPLYLALVRQWLKNRGEHPTEPAMVGGAFYSLRKRDQFKRVGMWAEDKRELAGLSKRSKKGIFPQLDARIAEDLMEIEHYLRAMRQGDFFLTAKQRPNPYYADNAIYRYDPISIRLKEKQKENGQE